MSCNRKEVVLTAVVFSVHLCLVSDGRYNMCLRRLGFDSKSSQIKDFNIGYHSFPAWCSAINGQCGEQAGKFTCVVGKSKKRVATTSIKADINKLSKKIKF